LQQKDVSAAVALLRRMTLVVGTPFEYHAAAASALSAYGQHAEAATFLRELVGAMPWESARRIDLANEEIAAGQDVEAARDRLIGLASATQDAYEQRLLAAEALAGSRPQAQLGSRELEIIARKAAVTPAEADKPYYYRARAIAAASAPDSAKVMLLRNALQDRPRRPEARLPLFRAALAFKRLEFALSILQPYMTGYSASGALPEGQTEEEAADNLAGSRLASLSKADRPVVAKQVGLAYLQLDQKQEALEYLRLSLRTDTSPSRRKETVQQIEEVKAAIRREEANANRRPRLREEVEPGVVVRPRLGASAGALRAVPKPIDQRRPQ
jgi:hypothetical protein